MNIAGFSVLLKKQNFLNIFSFFFGNLFFLVKKFPCRKIKILIFLLIFYVLPAFAVKVRFPDEELAQESVLPLIDPPKMVLNRNVSLKFRVELGAGGGFGLDEPYFTPFYASGLIAFHLTEVHSISVAGTFFPPYKSQTGLKLSQGFKSEEGYTHTFDPQKAPHPLTMIVLNYQYTPYYGKISLSKSWVMNLSIYGFAGPGLLVFSTNNRTLVGNVGIGQKLYFNKWFGIRVDFGFYGYYGPAITRLNLDVNSADVGWDQIGPEDRRLIVNTIANIGVIFLI